ncbi:MAG: hypothetical protein EA421_08500 [Gemmatimonadales bacterium]|nr:MAG: hypothetical protein EA421_08500 [Gemmatimonadales bacterium]
MLPVPGRVHGWGWAVVLAFLVSGCATGAGSPHAPPSPDPTGLEAAEADPTALPPGVRVFRSDGTPSSWDELLDEASRRRVILLGEVHNDTLGHRARHALVRALADVPGEADPGAETSGMGGGCVPHVISLEMLETDVQGVLDEYQSGLITRDHFLAAARPWENHDRDYEPYLELARECGFPVVAANPPRRYVNLVARQGEEALDALSPEARAFLPPLPVARPSDRYRAEWNAVMGAIMEHRSGEAGAEGTDPAPAPHSDPDPHAEPHAGPAAEAPEDPLLKAQNLWDAGMAWAVARAAKSHPQARVVHVAGAFHVQSGTGLPEHLDGYLPEEEPLLVVAYPVPPGTGFDAEHHTGLGHFILLSDR